MLQSANRKELPAQIAKYLEEKGSQGFFEVNFMGTDSDDTSGAYCWITDLFCYRQEIDGVIIEVKDINKSIKEELPELLLNELSRYHEEPLGRSDLISDESIIDTYIFTDGKRDLYSLQIAEMKGTLMLTFIDLGLSPIKY